MPSSFSLLTLNCFGGYLPDTGRRLIALAHELEQRSEDVVCLQEIQLNRYLKLFQKASRSFQQQIFEPYLHCPKGGLLTLARIPIKENYFIPYRELGVWYTPMFMDMLLHKGMLISHLEWAGRWLTVINTHILANYVGDWERRGMYARVEEQQLKQLAETVQAIPSDTTVLVAGDFNIPRGTSLYREFLTYSGLTDPLAGDTRPTHRPPRGVPVRYALALDYIFVRIPAKLSLQVESDLCFTARQWLNGSRQDYLSDHSGVASALLLLNRGEK